MPQPTTQRRWTEDTRTAFLLALRLYGSAMRAAAAIGRQPAVCYKVRVREPGFAAEWDRIVAEQRVARSVARRLGPDAVEMPAAVEYNAGGHRKRRDGLTTVKRRAFLRTLSETGKVEAACLAARVSDTAAYQLRKRDPDFAAAWERALAASAPTLEQIAYERAVHGWEGPVFAGGKQVGTRRRYSEPLLRQLLVKQDKAKAIADDPRALLARAHEAAEAAGGFFSTPVERDETNAAIVHQLAMIEKRLAGERRREAERLLVEGRVP